MQHSSTRSLVLGILIPPLRILRFLFQKIYPFTLGHLDRSAARGNHARLKQDVSDSFSYLSIAGHCFAPPDLKRAADLGFDFAQVDVLLPMFRLTIRRCRGEVGVFLAPTWLSAEGDDLCDLLELCDSAEKPVRTPFVDLWQASARLQENLECIVELLSVENYPATRSALGHSPK
jgi:hypothetical protein